MSLDVSSNQILDRLDPGPSAEETLRSKGASIVWNIIQLAIAPFHYLLDGWTLSLLWKWFVVPTFNLPLLTIPIAIGILVTFQFLKHSFDWEVKGVRQSFNREVSVMIGHIILPFLFLGIGKIVLLFIK